ncbi:MAG: ROK family transcriptional regulator [Phycisphaerae bacterium]|nr:ROK family transcriptional regulator [Phycisphaerae bacterium]
MELMQNQPGKLNEQTRKRNVNRYAILRMLHFEETLRRAELSRELKIRKSSVTNIIAELIDNGVVVANNPDKLRSSLSLNTETYHVLVASICPSEIFFARVHLDGSIQNMHGLAFDPHTSQPEQILEMIADGFREDIRRADGIVMGLGVADPGIVDPEAGVSHFAANLPHWKNIPVRQTLESKLGRPVHVNSDIRCQLWANAWFSRYIKRYRNMLYVGILDGLAAASIIHGQMVVGNSYSAGEFGHISAGNEMRPCACGKTDCLETYCSVGAILDEIKRVQPGLEKISSISDVAKIAREDRVVRNVLDRIVRRLAGTLSPIVAALDPQAVIIGSDDMEFSAIFGQFLHKNLQAELAGLDSGNVDILTGEPADTATIRGIAGMVIEQCFHNGELQLQSCE